MWYKNSVKEWWKVLLMFIVELCLLRFKSTIVELKLPYTFETRMYKCQGGEN